MRVFLLLLILPLWSVSARAENWRSEKHAIFMVIPDPPEWTPFPSTNPLALVGRGRMDRSAMFVLTAKPVPGNLTQTEMTEALARQLRQEETGSTEPVPTERMMIDGTTAFRCNAKLSSGGRVAHLDMIYWIYHRHIFCINLTSMVPVDENPELNTLVKSIRFLKK